MLTKELKSLGFEKSLVDRNGLRTATDTILEVGVVVHADDMFVGTAGTAGMKKFKTSPATKSTIKDLGKVDISIGCHMERDRA